LSVFGVLVCAYRASGLPANPVVVLVHQTCHGQGPAHSVAECPPIPKHPKYTISEHVRVLSVLLRLSCCAALCCHTAVLQPLGSATLRWRSRWVVFTGNCCECCSPSQVLLSLGLAEPALSSQDKKLCSEPATCIKLCSQLRNDPYIWGVTGSPCCCR
jgi:hypothetical protein